MSTAICCEDYPFVNLGNGLLANLGHGPCSQPPSTPGKAQSSLGDGDSENFSFPVTPPSEPAPAGPVFGHGFGRASSGLSHAVSAPISLQLANALRSLTCSVSLVPTWVCLQLWLHGHVLCNDTSGRPTNAYGLIKLHAAAPWFLGCRPSKVS